MCKEQQKGQCYQISEYVERVKRKKTGEVGRDQVVEDFKSHGRILYLILNVNSESLKFIEEWADIRPMLLGNSL